MKTRYLALLGLLLSFFGSSVAVANSYISDELFIYYHSGPGTQYRILGTIDSGTPVTVLESNKGSGYVKVRDSRGREGWLEGKYLSSQPAARERIPQLENALSEAETTLAEKQAIIEQQEQQITQLNQSQQQAQQRLNEVQQLNDQLSTRLDTREEDLQMRWFIHGGVVLAAGMLVGIVIPFLPRRRKRNQDRWM